jgi:hypothetical protein
MLTRLAHEMQPSNELPFVAIACNDLSRILPHQTEMMIEFR